ncbi:AraC family transcriptional regulator [Cohnella ginsengisoli]|uniref:AraC family transcriptional regulator n=2 Tax=Cohnella TaxID=329857 RepID=A0A9X4QQ43_9BACL|nr:AraC family transcriptional regulator [Cohnella ginsengisoli]MDG0794182.1 AraC family transcriptional regulator [Cohnella ginsengisoli]
METTPKYFSNYFKKTFGVNYVEYLNKVRLSHARDLLRSTSLSIAEIGEKTGYLNASTFTTTFKKYMGVSPSDYRKQNDQQIV